ncbi:hypothetical protein A3770_11p63890 [Chloropicon primus]|uniref:PhoPQ-activated pathogenicity-related protein n=1 Tax=Chloropicon primus TaxID=1764295 RepID=A0A5B8MU69_9CHLO|nr:hypothetical protein A3770_11p63890 [Chloropicon primus]|eukprot:QDZ23871.1 hypothetical protein A3770_11p63890 [Chloropicon primus]
MTTRKATWLACMASVALVLALVCSTVEGIKYTGFEKPVYRREKEDVYYSGDGKGLDLNKNLRVDPASNGTALDKYVATPDPSYKWEYNGTKMTGIMPGISGWTAYEVVLTSQTWLTEKEVGTVCNVWHHDMFVFVPDNLDDTVETAIMFITEGIDPPGTHNDKTQNILLGSAAATGTKGVTVALFQVPNQKCLFPDDPIQKHREEDAVIAYTWKKFIELTRKGDPRAQEWPLRLPMTKAAVRAMDATQDFLSKCTSCVKRPLKTTNFVAMGASKRGWTTWTTGAVDKRIIGMAPIVMDAANQHQLFHRWYQNFGGWSFAIHDYTEENLMGELDSPEFQDLLDIIDPYVYRERLTMPKLVITATGDEFFQAMDDHFWWNDMPGDNFLCRAANADHSEMTGIPVLLPSVISFVVNVRNGFSQEKALAEGRELTVADQVPQHPRITWSFAHVNEGTPDETGVMNVTVDVQAGPKPEKVWLQYSHTDPDSGRLDFRWFNLDKNCALPKLDGGICPIQLVWLNDVIEPVEQTDSQWTYSVSLKAPPKGWGAFFVEFRFPGISELFFELPYTVTTQTVIVPTKLPFPDCSGAECEGKLV